jgi:septal ring factor EnvC (AmiA/AmiB activator)
MVEETRTGREGDRKRAQREVELEKALARADRQKREVERELEAGRKDLKESSTSRSELGTLRRQLKEEKGKFDRLLARFSDEMAKNWDVVDGLREKIED